MRISLKGLADIKLIKLFDRAAETDDRHLAKMVASELAYRHRKTFEDQLRCLGKRAVRRENYLSFMMVAKLWREGGLENV